MTHLVLLKDLSEPPKSESAADPESGQACLSLQPSPHLSRRRAPGRAQAPGFWSRKGNQGGPARLWPRCGLPDLSPEYPLPPSQSLLSLLAIVVIYIITIIIIMASLS